MCGVFVGGAYSPHSSLLTPLSLPRNYLSFPHPTTHPTPQDLRIETARGSDKYDRSGGNEVLRDDEYTAEMNRMIAAARSRLEQLP